MSNWLEPLVSEMRNSLAEALELIEDPAVRAEMNCLVRENGMHGHPESLTERELVVELAKSMTGWVLVGNDGWPYDQLCACVPPLRRLRDALMAPEVHDTVKIPPQPCSIVDGRMPVQRFLQLLNEQVFAISVD